MKLAWRRGPCLEGYKKRKLDGILQSVRVRICLSCTHTSVYSCIGIAGVPVGYSSKCGCKRTMRFNLLESSWSSFFSSRFLFPPLLFLIHHDALENNLLFLLYSGKKLVSHSDNKMGSTKIILIFSTFIAWRIKLYIVKDGNSRCAQISESKIDAEDCCMEKEFLVISNSCTRPSSAQIHFLYTNARNCRTIRNACTWRTIMIRACVRQEERKTERKTEKKRESATVKRTWHVYF